MTTPNNPHPLAVEAAREIAKYEREWKGGYGTLTPDYPAIIHTTALESVIKAGEELDKHLTTLISNQDMKAKEWIPIAAAISQWRTLTTPPQATPDRPESTESGSDSKDGSTQRKDDL